MVVKEKRFGERCVGLGGWGWRGAGADGNGRWRKGSGRVRWYMVLGYLCLICIARMQYYRETTIQHADRSLIEYRIIFFLAKALRVDKC